VLAAEGPLVVAARAVELVERAERTANVSGSWLAKWLMVQCTTLTNDTAVARVWLKQVEDDFRRMGGEPIANNVEAEATLAALDGDYEQAAQLFGRAGATAFRSGVRWPISPITEPILAQVRNAVPADRFDAAWQTGDAQA
jgi:hypothetical protein